jgi:hypothetical protein
VFVGELKIESFAEGNTRGVRTGNHDVLQEVGVEVWYVVKKPVNWNIMGPR